MRDLLEQPILRPGSWIGGDRDGNPNVTADVVRLATSRAAYTALAHYFGEITALEEELSMSARLVKVSDELAALADACDEPARADEPYRRALRVIHARLTATAQQILDDQPEHELDLGLERYDDAGGAAGRPRRRRRVAARQRQRACWPTTGWPGCGKPCTPSVFTCRAWTCGRTPMCTRRSSPSCWRGRACTPTTGRCPSPTASTCWSPSSARGAR